MPFNKVKSMNTLDQISYRDLAIKAVLFLLPVSWVMGIAFANTSSIGIWSVLTFFQRFLPLKCPLSYFFGIQCPTCGLGRSLIYAWSGNFHLSLHYHFLGTLIYFSSYIFFFWFLFKYELKKEVPLILLIEQKTISLFQQIPKTLWIILVIIYTVWGFSRNSL